MAVDGATHGAAGSVEWELVRIIHAAIHLYVTSEPAASAIADALIKRDQPSQLIDVIGRMVESGLLADDANAIQASLARLNGQAGLFFRRNQYVHAAWVYLADAGPHSGNIRDIRKLGGPAFREFDLDDVRELTDSLSEVAQSLSNSTGRLRGLRGLSSSP